MNFLNALIDFIKVEEPEQLCARSFGDVPSLEKPVRVYFDL